MKEQESTDDQLKVMKAVNDQLANQLSASIPNEANERKSLTWDIRNKIFKEIIQDYSMLKKDKGIFHAQLMHAMDKYMQTCNDTGYKIIY